jgi:hypothetical protein
MTPSFEPQPQPQPHVKAKGYEVTKSLALPNLSVSESVQINEVSPLNEIIKKMLFQGKPLNADNLFHMKRELGDIMWYWMNACTALGLDPNEVIDENVRKLEARYPGGTFDAHYSENRKEGDL